jgi:hypothetical protein
MTGNAGSEGPGLLHVETNQCRTEGYVARLSANLIFRALLNCRGHSRNASRRRRGLNEKQTLYKRCAVSCG